MVSFLHIHRTEGCLQVEVTPLNGIGCTPELRDRMQRVHPCHVALQSALCRLSSGDTSNETQRIGLLVEAKLLPDIECVVKHIVAMCTTKDIVQQEMTCIEGIKLHPSFMEIGIQRAATVFPAPRKQMLHHRNHRRLYMGTRKMFLQQLAEGTVDSVKQYQP